MNVSARRSRWSLLPLALVLGALFVMPAAAQASGTSWFSNGEELGETPLGVTLDGGSLTVKSIWLAGPAQMTCDFSATGSVWNGPNGGEGQIEGADLSNCESRYMEACLGGPLTPSGFPWGIELNEPWTDAYRVHASISSFSAVLECDGAEYQLSGTVNPGVSGEEGSSLEFTSSTGLLSSEVGPWSLTGSVPMAGAEGEVLTVG